MWWLIVLVSAYRSDNEVKGVSIGSGKSRVGCLQSNNGLGIRDCLSNRVSLYNSMFRGLLSGIVMGEYD